VTLEAQITIRNSSGLHARPAVKLAQLAARFDAEVKVRVGGAGHWVRARSTARIMKLKAAANAELHFQADGAQASAALQALLDLVRRDFDEPPEVQSPVAGELPVLDSSEDRTDTTVCPGELASPGIAIGPLVLLQTVQPCQRYAGAPAEERESFRNAAAAATAALRCLRGRVHTVAAEILAFQLALLEDPEFLAPVLCAIDAGSSADEAWAAYLAGEIKEYGSAESPYLRERAIDLSDLEQRVVRTLCGVEPVAEPLPEGAVVVADELTPSQFLELDWCRLGGAATRRGSRASHVALLARSQRVPMLVMLDAAASRLKGGRCVVLDAEQGFLIPSPDSSQLRRYRQRLAARRSSEQCEDIYLGRPARLADGSPVKVYLNVDHPDLLQSVDPTHVDGIGLTRTEFLFQGPGGLPDEERQYLVYRRLVDWAAGRPVTIRTLDAGGDKPVAGLTPRHENNPFLGMRGVRLSLAYPRVFRVQLRALARAAVHGELRVMLPMITVPGELDRVREMLQTELRELEAAGVPAVLPSLGMMVEVPAAALGVRRFRADFYSIGSNDLNQYLMAAGRDCTETAELLDPLNPALLELVGRVAEHGAAVGAEVSVCGEMAASAECLPALLAAGIRVLSIPASAIGSVKAALAAL
jgi:phosphotransferase system enzyme I (PtsI)